MDLLVALILLHFSGAAGLFGQGPRWKARRALRRRPGSKRTATDLPRGVEQENCGLVSTGAVGGGLNARDTRMHAAHSACSATGGAILRLCAL